MMREVLSGTCESGRVNFVKTNGNTDLLTSLRKKIKKSFGRSKRNTTFVKQKG
jgi:hypothetical protein